ncbi:MAG TPA: hypothetical protein VN635_03380 [Conexibacter sp.]|nr:hypothetical protein [Conexibacter sp.]
MIGPEHETARRGEPGAAGFGDAVTFAFGDAAQGVYGSARLGLGWAEADSARASGLGLLFAGDELAAVDAIGGIELDGADWGALEVGDVRATVEQPLHAWQVVYDGDDGGFELRFEALSAPAELGDGDALGGSVADLHGYEQLCRVTGTARRGEQRLRVDCLGQRGHQWGAPDWKRIELARTVSAWFAGGHGVALASVRPADAPGHGSEAASACVLDGEAVTAIAEPLLSTTLDRDGRQRRASLELWEQPEDRERGRWVAHRAAGEAVCGTTLDLGRLRLDCAFFRWRMQGREGVGRYDVLRRAEP